MKISKKNLGLIALISASFLLAACDVKKSDPMTLLEKAVPGADLGLGNGQNPGGNAGEIPEVRPEDQLISFAYLQKTSLVSCKTCHARTSNEARKPLLLTAAQYQGRIDDVISETSSGSMPPEEDGYAPLNACEQALLEKWVELGAPETTNVKVYELKVCNPNPTPEPPPVTEPPVVEPPPVTEPPVVEPPPVTEPPVVEPPPVTEPPAQEEQLVTFDYLLKTALVSCAECHSKTKNEKKKPLLITLEQYQARISDVVLSVNEDEMPLTDNGASLLTVCEKAMLNKWVEAGAPEKTLIKVNDLEDCKKN